MGILGIFLLSALGVACTGNLSASNGISDRGSSITHRDEVMSKNDVCGFEEPVVIGPADRDGMVEIPPSHPGVLYFGRVDCAYQHEDRIAPSFAYPGISIRMRFEGDAVDMRLLDFGDGLLFNYYNVIIDGGAPSVIEVTPGDQRYELARNLSDGPHTVEVFKRVESCPGDRPNRGKAAFLGFRIRKGKNVLPLLPKPHRIEFIGDSITSGYGNEIAVMNPERFPFTPKNENAYKAWSAIAARMLNAEYMAVSYSGRGICRNWAGFDGDTLPSMYFSIFPDEPDSPLWETERFTPEITVINLGTNDYSEGAANIAEVKKRFRAEYADFLDTLRSVYPNTIFILVSGPMLLDEYPEGYQALTDVREALGELVEARRKKGDTRIYQLNVSSQFAPWGEDFHPSAVVHQKIAEELVQFIRDNKLL